GVTLHCELILRVSSPQSRLAVSVDQWSKAVRFAADDRNHERQSEHASANKRTRRASDPEPNRQRILERPRVNSLPGQCRAVLARPVDMRVLANLKKQIELIGKERIVVLELQPKKRKRFDERAAPGNDLRSSVRK